MATNPEPAMTDRLLDEVDAALPIRLVGLYLVGSAALGDHQGRRSDLDYVGVLDGPLSPLEFEALRAAHQRLGLATYEGIYVTADDLRRRPHVDAGSAHVSIAGYLPRAGFNANPATWRTLARHGIAVRGDAPETLGVHDPDDEMIRFCREQLGSYWRPWGRRLARDPKQALLGFTDGGVMWGTFGPLRLHCTAATGRIISKTEAIAYGRATFGDRWARLFDQVLDAHVSGRRQPLASRPARWRELQAFVELVTTPG